MESVEAKRAMPEVAMTRQRVGVSVAITLLLLLVAFWGTFASIVAIWWRSETFQHGFLILPIVGYLIWQRRQMLAAISPQPVKAGYVLLAGLALGWLLAYLGGVLVVQQLSVVAMVPVLLWTLLGTKAVKLLAFPLGYLFFAVPMGEFLVPTLQDITAVFTVKALQLSGMPVYLEGLFFSIPSGDFEVAKACSGIRYLIASLALGVLYAYVAYQSLSRRLAFIALSALVPIVANGVRAYGIVMLAHYSDYQVATGFDHIIYGWMFFGVVMFLLFWVGSFFREPPVDENRDAQAQSMSTSAIVGANILPFTLWALVIIVSGPLAAVWLDRPIAGVAAFNIALPKGQDGWIGPLKAKDTWHPIYEGPTAEYAGEYEKNQQRVHVRIAFYASQQQDGELVNAMNKAYDENIERRLTEGITTVTLNNQGSWPVLATTIGTDARRRLIWQWYEIGGLATPKNAVAKLYEARSRLLRVKTGSAAILLAADYTLDEKEANKLLIEFADTMLPQLRKAVGADG